METRNLIFIALSSIVFWSCGGSGATEKVKATPPPIVKPIYHYNVIMAPDLSNRLTVYKKPVTDNAIIDSVLNSIFRIATHNRKMNQMDKYSLDFINPKQIVEYNVNPKQFNINLSRFGTQQDERIKYIAPFEESSPLNQDKQKFSNELARITNSLQNNVVGSDIWTYLNEELDKYKIDTTTSQTTFQKDVYRNEYKNVLILFTDGYLESSNKFGTGKISKNFSQSTINSFREDYLKNGKDQDLATFFKNSGYGIMPLSNPMLKHLDIIVMELYDRSVGIGGATKSPTDMEIMKLFWKDWFEKSDVRNYEFVSTASTAVQARDKILKFVGVE